MTVIAGACVSVVNVHVAVREPPNRPPVWPSTSTVWSPSGSCSVLDREPAAGRLDALDERSAPSTITRTSDSAEVSALTVIVGAAVATIAPAAGSVTPKSVCVS